MRGFWGSGGRHRDPIQFPYWSDARRHRSMSGPETAFARVFLLLESLFGSLIELASLTVWSGSLACLECALWVNHSSRSSPASPPIPAAYLYSSLLLGLLLTTLPLLESPTLQPNSKLAFETSISPPSCVPLIGPRRSRGCSLWISLAHIRCSRRLSPSLCPTGTGLRGIPLPIDSRI